jgi:hypothetical protein
MTATAQAARVLRFEVPVDDRWHTLSSPGRVLHVAARQPDMVELWTVVNGDNNGVIERQFRVFGTGHPLPDEPMRHVGTTVAAGGALVWHCFERVGTATADR